MPDADPDDTVLVVTTPDEDVARRLRTALTGAGAGVEVVTAAVVRRAGDGALHVSDRYGAEPSLPGPAHEIRHRGAAALVGAVVASVDALLLGNALLSMVGATADAPAGSAAVRGDDTVAPEDVLAFLARDLPPGGSALLARVTEPGPAPVDAVVEEVAGAGDGRVRRYPAATLRSEIEADRHGDEHG